MKLTHHQRHALKAVFDRVPLYRTDLGGTATRDMHTSIVSGQRPLTYREFRRTVQMEYSGDAILVPWCGMWLGIERDGYTHS